MCHPSLIEGMSLWCCQQVIVVISSLNPQMYDQIAKLNERGISACVIQRHRMVSWFTAKEMTLSSYHFLIMKHSDERLELLTSITCQKDL